MRDSSPVSRRWTAVTTAIVLLLATPSLAAITLKLERRDSQPGRANVCVVMESGSTEVAGTQNDILFDSSCASLTKADCVASEHHGKPLHGSVPADDPSSFRSLVFALDNVDPMSDGDVYCCNFQMTGDDRCCLARMDRLGASDPKGVALDVEVDPGEICLTGAPVNPEEAGAQATGPSSAPAAPNWVWVAVLAALVVGVLFLALRRSS